jgi:hypothetical protein
MSLKITIGGFGTYVEHYLDETTREGVVVFTTREDRAKVDDFTFERRRRSGTWPVRHIDGSRTPARRKHSGPDSDPDGLAG